MNKPKWITAYRIGTWTSVCAAALLTTAMQGARADTNMIVNGSFEYGQDDGGGAYLPILKSGSTALTGWTVGLGGVVWGANGDGHGYATDGESYVNLRSFATVDKGPGVISQNVNTVVGDQYRLSFDFGQSAHQPDAPILLVSTGAGSVLQGFSLPQMNSPNDRYERFSFDFEATEAVSLISFYGEFGGFDADLDNVVMTKISPAVPEPETWALMLGNIGFLGVVARRRLSRRATSEG